MTRLNKPKDIRFIGNAMSFKSGFIKIFTTVKTKAINMANAKFSTLIPGK